MALTPKHQAIVDAAKAAARRHRQLAAVERLASARAEADVEAARAAAFQEVHRARLQASAARAEAEARARDSEQDLEAAERSLAAARRLRDAVVKVDRHLSSGSVEGRIRELRTSLTRDNLDRVLGEAMEPEVATEHGRLVVRLPDAQREHVRRLLTAATARWIQEVVPVVQDDLHDAIEEAWTPVEGGLPVAAPQDATVLALPAGLADTTTLQGSAPGEGYWVSREVPALERRYPLTGFWSDLGRQLRSLVFPALMLLTLARLSRETALMVAVPLLLPVAVWLVWRERAERRRKHVEDAHSAIADELMRWVEGRLDRVAIHLRDDLRDQLRASRAPWQRFYRDQVDPRVRGAEAAVERARQALRDAGSRDRAVSTAELDALHALLAPTTRS